MNISKSNLITRSTIGILALLIAVCLLVFVTIIEDYAKEDCFDKIEETTTQISNMFSHSMSQSHNQLTLFADILASDATLTDDRLEDYMVNFCNTQSFSAVCIHWRDGAESSYGHHPHRGVGEGTFEDELAKLPYISNRFSVGKKRSENCIFLAVPVVREGDAIAVLYGYILLDTFPSFISSTAYDGKCQFYIVDGNTGDFLMDEYHRYDGQGEEIPLSNLHDGSMSGRKVKPGYSLENMHHGIVHGERGYYVFRSQRTGEWYYTYYMPMGINQWSMQMTIDEPTAFAIYHNIRTMVFIFTICVIALSFLIIVVLFLQHHQRRKHDAIQLHKADYLNAVQSALITAHNNPDFVGQALKLVAGEIKAEKALLLTFDGHTISNIYYWPSLDMNQAKILIGVNIQEAFPVMFDTLTANDVFFCDKAMIESRFTPLAKSLFHALSVSNILLAPIADKTGLLRGAIATLNMNGEVRNSEMLELVTRDFYMAINNLENHNIIRKMGTIDYLTGVKNRNCFEAESPAFETMQAESLWCVYVDVNGLHDMNNTYGHSSGDALLCAVASSIKKIFGSEYSYRLGGDEFTAFRANSSHEEFMSYKYRLLDELAKKGYRVSVGFEGTGKNENGIFDVAKIMERAESIMYSEKRKYYEMNGLSEDRNHFPSHE